MTLHKELVAAFGQTEPPDVGSLQANHDRDDGYFWKKIDLAIVLSSSGEMVDIDRPPWRLGGKRRRNTLGVPRAQFSGEGGYSGFLWGQSAHALGVVRPELGGGVKTSPRAFNRFRTFHRAVLGGAKDPSIRAFLAFLQNWTPEATDYERASELAGAALVFRFHYDGCFLHQGHAARLIWARLANPAGESRTNAAG
ncbi:MAG: type I-C CRISPR-associated protein Cas8c/Csd1 [Caulobacteraceae bacterium]